MESHKRNLNRRKLINTLIWGLILRTIIKGTIEITCISWFQGRHMKNDCGDKNGLIYKDTQSASPKKNIYNLQRHVRYWLHQQKKIEKEMNSPHSI